MALILGIDPGSQITGFGVVDAEGRQARYVDSGCIRTEGDDLAERLRQIYEGISLVIARHGPEEIAVEQVFVHRNVDSALKLGQARGAAICATFGAQVTLAEYAARQVKQAIVGTGAASKEQVQHMVISILKLEGEVQADAADALAVALCHAHHRTAPVPPRASGRSTRRRWRG